jgi:hypothetical protein
MPKPGSAATACLLALAGLAGCATTATPSPHPAAQCRAEPVAWAIGQPATQAVMGRVWRESGAGLIRPISPDQAVRRDQRPDRINVVIGADNVITAIHCG